MTNLLAYIEQNQQESKRLIGLEYEQLPKPLMTLRFVPSSKLWDGN